MSPQLQRCQCGGENCHEMAHDRFAPGHDKVEGDRVRREIRQRGRVFCYVDDDGIIRTQTMDEVMEEVRQYLAAKRDSLDE